MRDADGDVGFASVTVVVRASSTDKLCLVNTDSDVDDGPAVVTTCADASLGGDGLLSLREALRVPPLAAPWASRRRSPSTPRAP